MQFVIKSDAQAQAPEQKNHRRRRRKRRCLRGGASGDGLGSDGGLRGELKHYFDLELQARYRYK